MALIGLMVAAAMLGRLRPLRLVRRRAAREDVDVLLVARLLALSIASGRPLGRALADVGQRLPHSQAAAIDDISIRANRDGLTRSLAETTGPLGDLAERMAKAQVTGAPVGPALDAFISTLHDAKRLQAVEEARTIGVKLILPLTLLLLPGFIALVVAPFVLEQLEGLLGVAIP
jgi:hypothetical protein